MRGSVDSINSYQNPSYITYNDYVKSKGFLLLRIEGLNFSHEIVKRGSNLYLGKDSYDIKDLTISDFILLLHEYDKNLKIKLSSTIEAEDLHNISSLFIADFNSVKIVQREVLVSPIKKDWVLRYNDVLNSSYILSDFKVFRSLTLNPDSFTETEDSFIIYNTSKEVKAFLEYRAQDLNIYCLHEIPGGDKGMEALVELGVYHVD